MKRILFFISFISVFSLQAVFAQAPTLKTAVDKQQILIGEQLKYSLQVSLPANTYNIAWLNVPDSFNHFEIVKRGKIDTIENNGILILTQTLTLTSFDSGRNTIPALPIIFDHVTDGTTVNLFTDSIAVNVGFSPMDSTTTFHDIKTIIEVKNELPWWVWLAGAVLLILLIFLIIYLVRYFKRRKKPDPLFNSKLTPVDEALDLLNKLENEQLLQKGEVKKFHSRLTEIFKRYLSRKTGKNMLNQTSSEVLISLHDTLLSKVDTASAAASLRMTDAVKFAKYSPPQYESESALISTKSVIQQIDKLIFDDHKV
jgi:hypothetical protein